MHTAGNLTLTSFPLSPITGSHTETIAAHLEQMTSFQFDLMFEMQSRKSLTTFATNLKFFVFQSDKIKGFSSSVFFSKSMCNFVKALPYIPCTVLTNKTI